MLLPVGRLISRRWSCHLSHEHSRAQHEKNCRTDGVKYSVQLAFAPINRTDAGTIGVTGKTYLVTVKSSFRTTFTDCFRFDVTSHRRAEHRWAGRVRYLPLRATVGG